jgi:hypothetical protein
MIRAVLHTWQPPRLAILSVYRTAANHTLGWQLRSRDWAKVCYGSTPCAGVFPYRRQPSKPRNPRVHSSRCSDIATSKAVVIGGGTRFPGGRAGSAEKTQIFKTLFVVDATLERYVSAHDEQHCANRWRRRLRGRRRRSPRRGWRLRRRWRRLRGRRRWSPRWRRRLRRRWRRLAPAARARPVTRLGRAVHPGRRCRADRVAATRRRASCRVSIPRAGITRPVGTRMIRGNRCWPHWAV